MRKEKHEMTGAKNYAQEPSSYCDIDGYPLSDDGSCDRCERSAAAEQAEDDADDMEYEA
jgi:hypothetical protein